VGTQTCHINDYEVLLLEDISATYGGFPEPAGVLLLFLSNTMENDSHFAEGVVKDGFPCVR